MRNYKKWSAEERKESLALTNRGKKLGWIKEPTKCRRCGQVHGILQLHNEDYDVTLRVMKAALNRVPASITESELKELEEVLEPLCWRCHMIHHSIYRNPKMCAKYWEEIAQGKIYPPVYKHNFKVLEIDHKIA